MPKLRKETIDGILSLIEEGYRDVEIADKLGVTRQTAAKYRHRDNVKTHPLKPMATADSDQRQLSSQMIKRLYDLQGVLGVESLEEAVDVAYSTLCAATKYMLKYEGLDTVEDVILKLEKDLVDWSMAFNEMEQDRDKVRAENAKYVALIKEPTKGQIYGILTRWGVSEIVRVAYRYVQQNDPQSEGNLVEFMDSCVLRLFDEHGYGYRETYDPEGKAKIQLILPDGRMLSLPE